MKTKFYQKIAKAGAIKILITISFTVETMHQLLSNLRGGPYEPGAGKKYNKFKDSKNLKKMQIFFKNCYLNLENYSMTSRSYAVTYNQTLKEVMSLLRLEKHKK